MTEKLFTRALNYYQTKSTKAEWINAHGPLCLCCSRQFSPEEAHFVHLPYIFFIGDKHQYKYTFIFMNDVTRQSEEAYFFIKTYVVGAH